MAIIPVVKDLLALSILQHAIFIVIRKNFEEIARRIARTNANTVRLMRYDKQICHMKNNNAVFKAFCLSDVRCFFRQFGKAGQLNN